MDIKREYDRWIVNATADDDIVAELKTMDDREIEDAFYRDLTFGTGGLRGVIGAGTNRINIYTIAKASQGLSNYLRKNFVEPSVVIGYDSRIKSDVFAKVAASVFAVNGIKVNIWPVLMPVPTVSFATRYLHASAGIMVTASHNPGKYNGYKVYGADGCQITTEAANEILTEIEKLDIFLDVKTSIFEANVAKGNIQYISDDVYTAFVEQVKRQSVLFGEKVNKDIAIIYSPLNGTGLNPVIRTLQGTGYTNITVVKEQERPDGKFPTCPYPNPEIKEAMRLGMEYARKYNADLLLATDPDCDRVGIAVKNKMGEYELLTGNQTGLLLLDYICSQRIKHGKMPTDPVMIKTIVTADMGEQIASYYGLRTINVLTGFKFIGEQIGKLEQENKAESYVFGLRYRGHWKDVGTWNMMAEVMADKTKGKVILDETCENTNVVNELNIPILCMGCKDMIIAVSGDGILISDKERSGYMKSYVEKIETEAMYAEKSWGTYTVIDVQPGSMTIKISMKAGEMMSYHMHNKRQEVWTVISGKGLATINGKAQLLRAGDVITIAAGCKHTVEAITVLDMIEVQLGEEISVTDKIKFPMK